MMDPKVSELAQRIGAEIKAVKARLTALELASQALVEQESPVSGVDPHAGSHGLGGSDPIQIDISQVSGLSSQLNSSSIPAEFVFVSEASDFPDAVGGVITLQDNYTYFITTTVDLAGNRIVAGQNTTLIGGSSENCYLKSTGLNSSTALITSEWSLPIRNISITHGTALDLDASGHSNQALDWFGVNFVDCASVGTIANYENVIFSDCAFLNSSGLTLDGTIATFGASQCLFNGASAATIFTIPSTATISRRFRIIYSSFIVAGGETGINLSASASIPTEGYILDTVNFSGGGTYVTGVTHTDDEALFVNCRGVTNTSVAAGLSMTGNVTATDIVTTGVAVKVAGTTSASAVNQKFTHADNRLTYTGALTRVFKVTAILTVTGPNNAQLTACLYKTDSEITESCSTVTANGVGKVENVQVQAIVSLSQNDYIEVWIANDTNNTDVTVDALNVIIDGLN